MATTNDASAHPPSYPTADISAPDATVTDAVPPETKPHPTVTTTQVPEWEHIAAANAPGNVNEKAKEAGGYGGASGLPAPVSFAGAGQNARTAWRSARETCARRLDAVMPPDRRYLRMTRRVFLIVLGALLAALLILIIGLAAGLSAKKSNSGTSFKNLPLPSNSATFTGDLTYYAPGLGACGWDNTDADPIVAVSHILFDAAGSTSSNGGNSNNNPLCGRKLRARRYDSSKGQSVSIDLTVVDRCTGCQPTDLDTTITVFAGMADVDQGRVDVTWAWLD